MKLKNLIVLLFVISASSVFAADESVVSASVEQAKAKNKMLSDTLSVYGKVQPDPDAVLTLSLPRAGMITRVKSRPGQRVKHGDVLLEFSTSPTARNEYIQAQNAVDFAKAELARQNRLFNVEVTSKSQVKTAKKALADAESAYIQAKNAVDFARSELARNKRLFNIQMSTKSQVNAAQKALDDAKSSLTQTKIAVDYAKTELAKQNQLFNVDIATQSQVKTAKKALADAISQLDALKNQGKNQKTAQIIAPVDGLITQINIKQGDLVQENTAALSLATESKLIALLGAEPEDIRALKPGMTVALKPVFTDGHMTLTKLREIHSMINPSTHLVDLLAPIPPEQTNHLILGSYLTAEITISKHQGVTVPRNAVLEDDNNDHFVFTVVDGKAKKVIVTTGLESDQWIEITSGIKAGQKVINTGNYVLEDGMRVRGPQ